MSIDVSGVEFNNSQPSEDPTVTQEEKKIEVLQMNNKEEAFSYKKYFLVALMIGAIAGAVLPFCLPASIVLFALATWYLWSSVIILANRALERTRFEKSVHLLHAAAMEINSGVAAAALFPFTLFKSYHEPKGSPDGRPILMVNGYMSFGSTWHYQRQRLIEEGFGPIYTINVGTGKSIKTYAQEVQEKVKEIQRETGRNDLTLIGHSKGGLVSSYFTVHLADEIKADVKDVVTIGSPLAGTPMAYLGPGKDAAEMRTRSEFHQDLRKTMEKHPGTGFSHIASEVDEVVPLSSAILGEDRSRQLVLKDMGHLGLVFSSRVADQVCAWLKA